MTCLCSFDLGDQAAHPFGLVWVVGREDLNLHTLTGTCTSSMRVCQFRHDRELHIFTPTSSNSYLKLISGILQRSR